jgi:hypothetical protein
MRAFAWGFGILVVMHGLWLVSLEAERFPLALAYASFISPMIAGFVSSALAMRRKVLVGASMCLPATALTVLLNLVYQGLGRQVDFPGFKGGLLVAEITLVSSAALSTAGGVAGHLLTRRAKV